ncbi:ER lumen protein retaining receptor-domain-containing protein [Aspergillus taichungensis]|uniref:ER lumen protein retaining receptor-domain-containing protein n=1 Tax=Aspergillus taichungensis TaxID=482145 RepID=A0A2J5HH98_9EURO|nr:ER lumen protein retaining receptor-domain-containing protein [Aspergillus taichungensis]
MGVMQLNVFRLLGDLAHISSKCILIFAIQRNKSAEGVSLLTQVLYAVVFVSRYLDLFRSSGWAYVYLVFFKLFYIFSSFYIIFLMMKLYPRTRERERAWKLAIGSVGVSLVLAPIVILIFHGGFPGHWFTEIFWAFSIILESVCVLPQLLLLRQTTIPTVLNSYYLVTLGSYRAFYILNWLVRGFGSEHHWEPIADIFGIIQTAFYIDFAWVYYTRQRVKLRNGSIVDAEDFRNSWLVSKVLNFRQRRSMDEEQSLGDGEEYNGSLEGDRPRNNRWGARGVSIAADDTLDRQNGETGDNRHEGYGGLEEFVEDDDAHWEDHTDGSKPDRHSPTVPGERG